MRVGVVIPSYYNGAEWEKNIKNLTDTLPFIKNVDNLIFLFNFQRVPVDNSEESIRANNLRNLLFETIKELNSTWSYKYREMGKYNPVSMCKIRNDAMRQEPNCDVYIFFDDDHRFKEGSGDHYNLAIKAFEEDPELGLVMCAGYLGGYNYVGKLKYDYSKFWMTSRGLFIRNLRKCPESPIYSASVLEYHAGGYEETIAALEVIKSRLKMATLFNCPTLHTHTVHMEAKKDKNEDDEVHNVDVSAASLERFLFEEFGLSNHIDGANSIRNVMKLLYKKGLGYQYG